MPAFQPVTLRLRKGTPECKALVAAWNQGIDARLEGITCSKAVDAGVLLDVEVGPKDIPVLTRRLKELRKSFPRGVATRLAATLTKRGKLPPMSPTLRAYITTAIWNSTDEAGRPLEELGYGPESLADPTLRRMDGLVVKFLAAAAPYIATGQATSKFSPEERAGYDLWLTQVGSGCTFEEENWGEGTPNLRRIAAELGSLEGLYVGDDGLLYLV